MTYKVSSGTLNMCSLTWSKSGRATDMEVSAAQWAHVAWAGLYLLLFLHSLTQNSSSNLEASHCLYVVRGIKEQIRMYFISQVNNFHFYIISVCIFTLVCHLVSADYYILVRSMCGMHCMFRCLFRWNMLCLNWFQRSIQLECLFLQCDATM